MTITMQSFRSSRYDKANAALNACNAGLGVELLCLPDARVEPKVLDRLIHRA